MNTHIIDPKLNIDNYKEVFRNENTLNGYFLEVDNEDAMKKFLQDLSNKGAVYTKKETNSPKGMFFTKYRHKNIHVEPGMLFTKDKSIFYDCQHGHRWYRIKEDFPQKESNSNKKTRSRRQNTKKMNCPATLNIVKITVFPEYKVPNNMTWRAKKNAINDVKREISESLALSETRYYFSISLHHNHPAETAFFHQTIDASLQKEINDLIQKGISNVQHIKQHLKDHVRQHHADVPFTSTAFHPKTQSIYNYVLKCLNEKCKTALDQEKLLINTKEWNKNEDSCFFRPYSEENRNVESLLLCYQNEWQKKLLKRYGSVCYLDATYKTMKYALPLFFLTVKTNVNYAVVGIFIIQHENAKSIEEALRVLKSWNLEWKPDYFMTDYCQAEINAIESTFGCPTFICSFYREQCWLRWLKKKDNMNNAEDSKILLKYWRSIAHSETKNDFNKNVEELQKTTAWITNKKAQRYFSETWLTVKEKWCEVFFGDDFIFKITTNNGAEAQNRALEYSYLKKYSNKSLTSVVEVIINEFFTDLIKKYTIENSRLNSQYKTYSKEVPEFLLDRPDFFIKHVYKRFVSAKTIYNSTMIHQLDESKFVVKSETSELWYAIDFSKPTCTCDDFRRWRFPCKHFCAIFHFIPNHSFNDLPKTYLENPFLVIDEEFSVFKGQNPPIHEIQQLENDSEDDYEIFEVLQVSQSSHDSETPDVPHEYNDLRAQATEIIEPATLNNHNITNEERQSNPTGSGMVNVNCIKAKMKSLMNKIYLVSDDNPEELKKCYDLLDSAEELLSNVIAKAKENGLELLPLSPPVKRKKKQ